MFESQSCGAAARVGAKKPRPVVTASSTTITFSGSSAASEAPRVSGVMAPVAGFGGGPADGRDWGSSEPGGRIRGRPADSVCVQARLD